MLDFFSAGDRLASASRDSMRLVAFLWVAFALNYLDRQMAYSIFPALQSDLQFSTRQLSLVGTVFLWVYTLAMPVAGRLADSWRPHRMILASLALWSASTLASGLSRSPGEFLVWRGVMGITESLYYPAALTLLATAYSESARSRALGLHQSAQLAGVTAGGWYGGWAADHVGWRTGFVVAAVAGLAYTLVLGWVLRDREGTSHTVAVRTPGNPSQLIRSWCYLALCATFALFCAMLWVFYAWLPVFLTERYHLSMTDSGWNATVFIQLSTAAGIVAGGALADRLSRRFPQARFVLAALGVIGSAPFAYLTFAADSLVSMRIYSAAFGAFGGLLMANAFAAAYDVVARPNWGLGGGMLNMAGGIAAATMIFLAGVWKESVGFAPLMAYAMTAAIACAVVLLVVVALVFERERTEVAG